MWANLKNVERALNCKMCYCFSFPLFAQTSSRSSDSLARLYEMDDHPDRRPFLDKLLSFMEEKGTPITQCPTISKNPLDLFRLYLYTKERGGFIEVSGLSGFIQTIRDQKFKSKNFWIKMKLCLHFGWSWMKYFDRICDVHSVKKHVKHPKFFFSAQSRKRGKILQLNWALAPHQVVPTL